jgi:2-C-methyl-D-erythritol 4-phosphate cytidylyltransferase
MKRYAIILIAGQSQRFGIGDKCLALVHGKPIVAYSFEAFRRTEIFDRYLFVYRDITQKEILEKFFQNDYSAEIRSQITWVSGGEERAFSVDNALLVIHSQFSTEAFVFIHDGARPLITAENILSINGLLSMEHGVVLAHRATDTMVEADIDGDIDEKNITTKDQRKYLERTKLWALETPQAFYFPKIFKDYRAALQSKQRFTDDSSAFSGTIKILENKNSNLKITAPQDLELAQFSLKILAQAT